MDYNAESVNIFKRYERLYVTSTLHHKQTIFNVGTEADLKISRWKD